MLKSMTRAIVPGPVRRWLQYRKQRREIANFAPRVVEHNYGDVHLKIDLPDPMAAGWYDHDWPTLPELDLLSRHRLQPGARVFDVGAHQGVVGLMIGHRVGPAGQVVLLEPNPHNVAACVRNAALNDMPWVIAHQAAVSDRAGTLLFNEGLNGQAGELSDYAGLIRVPALTIDDLTQKYGAPDVVMVDVEGFECRVLAGSARTLAGLADWAVEVHVGCGLEAAGNSIDEVLSYFPPERYGRFVHGEGDREPMPLENVVAAKLRERFFLTAIAGALT
jgi:FkbM family methyltransferase